VDGRTIRELAAELGVRPTVLARHARCLGLKRAAADTLVPTRVAAALAVAVGTEQEESPADTRAVGRRRASEVRAILKRHGDTLLAIPGVRGVGVGETLDGAQYIRVYCEIPVADIKSLPGQIEGLPVRPTYVGRIRARSAAARGRR
jgi:hypothetical protein